MRFVHMLQFKLKVLVLEYLHSTENSDIRGNFS